jgi:nucleotide-binding universal stress UspA family protein
VDFSSNGRAVLAQALALAHWHDAELDVLYVRPGRQGRHRRTDDGLRAHLAEFVAQANANRTEASTFVLAGDPVTSFAEHVDDRPADLAVVGQDGPRRALYRAGGRFAAAVTRRLRCPVITVTSRAPVLPSNVQFRRIVCGVDASFASLAALDTALTLTQQSGGRLTVLHVVDHLPSDAVDTASSVPRFRDELGARSRAIRNHLRTLVPPDALHWCDVDCRVVPGVPHSTLAAIAAAQAADLVVVGRPPRTWLAATGSTGAGVLAQSTCAVLSVPGPAGLRSDWGMFLEDAIDMDEVRSVCLHAARQEPASRGGMSWTS